MTLATILSRTQQGLDAPLVRVEVDSSSGLPTFSIVGLAAAVVRESKDRVRAALTNCGFEFPSGRITVNLAPADLPKEGGRFDLPIAMGILVAASHLPKERFAGIELYGELSLSGDVQGIRGALPTALQATRDGHALILPTRNATEAALVRGGRIHRASHLDEVCRHMRGDESLPTVAESMAEPHATPARFADLADVRGQARARRALEIAAAGQHSLLLIGPPGAGKSMLAQRLPGLLPPMSEEESLEVAAVRQTSRGLGAWTGADVRIGVRITPCPGSRWSVVGRTRGPARSRLRITACCSSMSCPSSTATHWRCCASRSRPGTS
jgi:magnesium chelatase family protein